MKQVPLWTLTLLSTILCTVFLSWLAQKGINSLNTIVNPCHHGGVFNGTCDCSNSNGLFGGDYCEESQCKNGGVLVRYSKALRDDVISVYGCRCPSKWTGLLCDKCYAEEECSGPCKKNVAEGPYGNCNRVCLPSGSVADCAIDLDYTGVCNACNGHGICDERAECKCEGGWFGPGCTEQCECGENGDCKIVNGKPKCFCKEGYFNEPSCDAACPGVDCNGHGSCYYDGKARCACNDGFIGEDCAYECPRRLGVSCSGHGECYGEGKCRCDPGWFGDKCDCNPEYTCFGHGECSSSGECLCYSGEGGSTKVNAKIHSMLEGAIDTYEFNAKAHYVSFVSTEFFLMENMILNVTRGALELPIFIKTAVKNGSIHYGELEETSGLANYFGLNGMGPFDFEVRFSSDWNPLEAPSVGYYAGPRCLECQPNWHPTPVMGDTTESCNVYCNPNSKGDGFPFSGLSGFGCWGRGQCDGASCKCDIGTDPDTNCAKCLPRKYPKLQWVNSVSVDHCSIDCLSCGNGRCNELYDGSNDLCVCDLLNGMDTLNASSRCMECKRNWFPKDLSDSDACSNFCSDTIEDSIDSGCDDLIRNYTETKEDVLITTKNLFGEDVDVLRRVDAPEKARVINCLNCQTGVCGNNRCECPEGVTGVECQNACKMYNDEICAGHGVCGQNPLHVLFDPKSDLTTCECNPQDQYTDAAREYYQRQGVLLDPKPSKEYYGSACEHHCPTYNQDVCASRGNCKAVPVGSKRCKEDEDCDGFCAVTTSPWDELGKLNGGVSYFLQPPGSVQCKSLQCHSDIEDRDWSEFCVAMLKGLYPEQLNSPTCGQCDWDKVFSSGVSSPYFVSKNNSLVVYDAWGGEHVKSIVVDETEYNLTRINRTHYVSEGLTVRLGKNHTLLLNVPSAYRIVVSHDNSWCDMSNEIESVEVCSSVPETSCYRHVDKVECTMDDLCLYDISLDYQRKVKQTCKGLNAFDCDNADECMFNSNQKTCDVRTYCRARSCQDTINDLGISPFCTDISIPEWCPATANRVPVTYQEMPALKNVVKRYLNASSIEDCARQVSLLGKSMFEFPCYYYDKVYDFQTGVGVAYRVTGLDTSEYKREWENQCFSLTSQLTAVKASSEMFYRCWNLREKNFPFQIGSSPRGGIKLFHEAEFNRFTTSVSNMKQSEEYNVEDFVDIEVNGQWCKNHIESRYPTGSMLSYVEAIKTGNSRTTSSTVCSSGSASLALGGPVLFWENIFKRQYGPEWACRETTEWNRGPAYYLRCKNGVHTMDDSNDRYSILSKLTPDVLESCIMVPNMDAVPNKFNVLSRTQSRCLNVERASRGIDPVRDERVTTPYDESIDLDPLDPPELLSSSLYVHKPGTCLDGKLLVVSNESEALARCGEGCDGYSYSSDGWFTWAFGTFQELEGYISYVKESSLQDDCRVFVKDTLFEPKAVPSSRYSVPEVSQAVLVEDSVLELTKKQAGAIQMDGWTYPLELEQSSRFYVTGSNLPNNLLLVKYIKVQVDFTGLPWYSNRRAAELACFSDPSCNGLLYPSDTFDEYGFGIGKIYTTTTQAVPGEGNAYYAPNLFRFVISENKISSTEMLDRPYDLDIVWPAADYYGERDIQLFGKTGWSPSHRHGPWTVGDTLLTNEGILTISGVKQMAITDIPAERFSNASEASSYALELGLSGSHKSGDFFSPSSYSKWRDYMGNDKVSVFEIEQVGPTTLQRNVPYGRVHVTTQHVERNDIEIELAPITLCFVNVRGNASWDHLTTDTSNCKFESKYYANGTLVISPDRLGGKIGHLIPNSDLKSGIFVESNSRSFYHGPKAAIASTKTIKNIPSLSFDTKGSLSVAFTKNGKETFDLTIIDNFAYVNKNFNVSIPKSPLGWTITYKDDRISVNDNAGIPFRGNVVPDTIHIWNVISNSSARVMNLKHNGISMFNTTGSWSTSKSMYPGESYAAVGSHSETISLPMTVKWQKGSWISDESSDYDLSKEDCIHFAMNSEVRYVSYTTVCTLHKGVVTFSDSVDGYRLMLPKTQYHLSGWAYVSDVSKILWRDKLGNYLMNLDIRSGYYMENNVPRAKVVLNEWVYVSINVNRVERVERNITLGVVRNSTVEPMIIGRIGGCVTSSVNMLENSSTMDCSTPLDNGTLTNYLYHMTVQIGDLSFETSAYSVDSYIDGSVIETSNVRMMPFRVRNRRSASTCNIKEQLFDIIDEIALQECGYSESCYKGLKADPFEVCLNNEKYRIPEYTPDLAESVDWVSYCDYAFPDLDEDEVCEGLWISAKINDEIKIFEHVEPLKRILSIVYSNCSVSACENVSRTTDCDGVCSKAELAFIDANDNEKRLLLHTGLVHAELLDWHTIRCNSYNDHVGIHDGDWVPECDRIDHRFPVFECVQAKALGSGEVLGFGKTVSDCKALLGDKTPRYVQIGGSECIAFYEDVDTEFVDDYNMCSVRYGGIPDPKKATEKYTIPGCDTYPFDEDFYSSCFAKTSQYSTCSTECLDHLRSQVDDQDCTRIANLQDIKRLNTNCTTCSLNDVIPQQFCAYQTRYHDIRPGYHGLFIPDLETTSCSDECIDHLENALSYKDWEKWCMDYASGDLEGFCSRTDCSCDEGYDGLQCELKCPMGSSDGKDATCSGSNGYCVPKDGSDILNDAESQTAAGEIEGPPWKKGPSTVSGMCECIVGSGEACEMECLNNNNGTYGPLHLNQYGICDSYMAIVKPLPPCTRYNSFALTSNGLPVPPNSTTYDMSRIIYTERLLHCSDEDMIHGASVSELSYEVSTSFLNAKDATRVFQYCFPFGNFDILDDMRVNPKYNASKWYADTENSIDVTRLWERSTNSTRSVTSKFVNGTGLYLSDSISLWVNNGYSVTVDGVQTHVLLYGDVPRKYPGLVSMGDSVLMFGGRIYYTETDYEETDSLYVLKMEYFTFSNQKYTTISFSEASVSGSPGARSMPVMVESLGVVYMFGGNKLGSVAMPETVWELRNWTWRAIRPIVYNDYNPMQVYVAWMADDIMLNGLVCKDKCVSSNHSVLLPSSGSIQTTKCVLSLSENELFFDSEKIASWPNAVDRVRIWYYDWRYIDVDFGEGFEKRFEHIFYSLKDKVESTLPRVSKVIVEGSASDVEGIEMSIDECRMKSEASFDYVNGKCVLNGTRYKKIARGGSDVSIVKETNRIYKRALMMQGRYSVLNEMGINSITDEWQGFDWMIRREVGNIQNLPTGSIHMYCVSDYCKRSSAVSFSKAKYTKKEAQALCASECGIPCDSDCNVIDAYTVPETYYMLDFETPDTNQTDTYHLIVGREAYTIRVMWQFNGLGFEKPLNENRVFRMEGKDITINITNADGTGGIRLLWSIEGWLFKSREAFNNYYVDQTHANRNLHRGGTCGTSGSETCPGAKTFYNVPCSGQGICELSCECVCDKAPEEYLLRRLPGEAPDTPDGSADVSLLTMNPAKSPFRGNDCSITCPGYDGWSVDGICSGHGSCGDRGQCICDYGYVGDNCQFQCPGFGGKICGKKGSCTLADISSDSFRISDHRNKFRFFSALKSFYSTCNSNFKASKHVLSSNCKDNNVCVDGLKKFVGESCTTDSECHSNICGGYHGCDNVCVRPDPETFPSPKGILIDKEVKYGITPEWKDYNCPSEDVWYDTMWVLLEGEIGTLHFEGSETVFKEADGANKIEKGSFEEARSWCDMDELCLGVSNNTYYSSKTMPLYFRPGSKQIWIKNPFTNYGGISNVMAGLMDGVCTVPSQQEEETPWVRRPKTSFLQKYDEPLEDFVIGGYGGVMDWGYNASTGLTTIRDLEAPTVTSIRECEILPNFELRCPTCDCFSDSIQGFWDGPMCSMCKRGYATKTCKKVCPGYDGKNDKTICSGNGVCNFGIEGTGRCMCGGKGGSETINNPTYIYKDQDLTPPISSTNWCRQYDLEACEMEPYCVVRENECTSVYLSRTARPAVEITYPEVHEYSYYHVRYREYSSFVWPKRSYLYSSDSDAVQVSTEGIAREQGLGPIVGTWHPERNVQKKHYYDLKAGYENVTVLKTHATLYDAKVYCDSHYECIGITKEFESFSSGDPSPMVMHIKNRRGEEGCLDFHHCGSGRYFGNTKQEGCCETGGLRGHGIPESMTRWLFKPTECQNTFSIASAEDNIVDGTFEFSSLEERVEAVNKVCDMACTNGFPSKPDLVTKKSLLTRIFNGCCSCGANSANRPNNFWNMRFSSKATTDYDVPKWWTPRAYNDNDVAAKVNGPSFFAGYDYRMEKYKENNFNECPLGKEVLCENDCALCETSRTGYNCAAPCAVCLMGGYCDNTPSNDGSSKCECISESLDPHGGCCPVGFSLITGSDILARSSQIVGIKAGLITFYENNRGEEYNGASAYFKAPETDLSVLDTAFAYSGKYLKSEQIQAGCYPCPGMFTSTSICDKDSCTAEDSELTLERLWTTTVPLEKKDDLWSLKLMPYEYQPQFYDFPFGYPESNSYYYTEAFDFMVSETSSRSFDSIDKARRACNNDATCKYISHVPPPPGDKPVWYDNVYVEAGHEQDVNANSYENCWNAARFLRYLFQFPTLVVYETSCKAYWQVTKVVYSDVENKMAYYSDKKFYLFDDSIPTTPRVGYVTYIKDKPYKEKLPYMSKFSDLYLNGNQFSNSCGGKDYCQAVQRSYNELSEEATSIFPNRLGCSTCDVRNIFTVYPYTVSVGKLYPIQNYHLGFSFSTGCAKCLPGQGGASSMQRIYEFCFPEGCESTDFVSDRYDFFSKWDVTANISYPTNEQKLCNGKLNDQCIQAGLALPMRDLSWKPSLGCSSCAAGLGFGYDLDNDGIIDDSQFNSNAEDELYVNGDNICYENTTGCVVHHVSNDVVDTYGTVRVLDGILYETGKGQVDPYNFLPEWPKRVYCRKCPINTFSTDNTNCQQCPVGKTTIVEGSSKCTACEPGRFYSLDPTLGNESKCVSCPPGMYQNEINKRSHRDLVPNGWRYKHSHETAYNDLPSYAKGYGGCKVCELGKFNPYYNQETCFGCPRGFSGKEGTWGTDRMVGLTMAESCETCAVGRYQDVSGKAECKSCEDIGTNEQELFKPSETCVNNCQNGQWHEYPACVCECDAGYIGTNCDVFDPCANDYCNGASCTVENGEAVCDCSTLDTFKECSVLDGSCPVFEGKKYSGERCNIVEYHPKCCPVPFEPTQAASVSNIWTEVLDDIATAYFWFGRPRTLKGGWEHTGNGIYVLKSTEECSDTHCVRSYPLRTQEHLFTDRDRNKHNSKADCYKTCPRGTYWIVPNNTLWENSVTYYNYSWWQQGSHAFLQSPDSTSYGSVLNISASPKDITDLIPVETSCQPCHYTEYNDEPNQLQCKQCAGGYYSNLQIEPCKICNPGTYRNVSSPQICYECEQGQYQDLSGQQICKHCTELSFQDLKGQASCKICPAGKHVPNFSVTNSEAQCITCPAGQYQDEPGQMSQTQCKLCPVGKYQPNAEASSCLDCDNGYYQDQVGQTGCKSCPSGKGTKHTSSDSSGDCGTCSVAEAGKTPIQFDWCVDTDGSTLGANTWGECLFQDYCDVQPTQYRKCEYNHVKNQGFKGPGCAGHKYETYNQACGSEKKCCITYECTTREQCDSGYERVGFQNWFSSGCNIATPNNVVCKYESDIQDVPDC